MAANNITSDLNAILNPFLFQVVGSTPESIKDTIKNTALKNNPVVASRLAAACVFSAAVNKSTMENFISKPEMAEARPIISAAFSISGKANMTGLTLLGHCLLTTDFVKDIVFCVEFRRKMGQDHLWAGNLSSGSLSEKQKEILVEKKRVTDETSAKLLASGFLKYTGIVRTRYTAEESRFWGEEIPASIVASGLPMDTPTRGQRRPTHASSSSIPSPPSRGSAREIFEVRLSDNTVANLPAYAANYFLDGNDGDVSKLANSVERNGVDAWIMKYTKAARDDPERSGFQGGTVLG